jgi:pimeloyl-ACP methyl ester carboxylesterase
MTRHFIAAGGRRVHYRAAGSGPPVLMLHGSPGDSEMLEHEIAAAAAHFTVFALDTPGFGLSEALPGETLTVRDLAAATVETMRALGLPPCRVFGTHTGAAIALELGVGWPDRVTGLLMEGLPAFTQAEIDTLFRNYFAPMVPDPLGGHLTSTWMRFRDQFTWFPWPSRDVTRLNPYGRPSPADIHHWVSMFYRGCASYGPAYRAACFYGQRALRAAEHLRVPAIYTATVEDMLHSHLARLPPLQAHQRTAPLPSDAGAKHAAIVAYVQELPGGNQTAPVPAAGMVGPSAPYADIVDQPPAMQFLTVSGLQCLVRTYGDRSAPALMIAHDTPGSGVFCDALARDLAQSFHVIVPDLPGCGESAAPGEAISILECAADALLSIAGQLNLKQYTLLGMGSGAAVGACVAARDCAPLSMLLVHAPNAPDESVARAIAPDLPLAPEGAHWLRAWLMVRDNEIYQPWCDGSVAAQRRTQGNFDAAFLHDRTCAIMAARTTYHRLPREAWRFDTLAAIRHARVPVHVLAASARVGSIIALAKQQSITA